MRQKTVVLAIIYLVFLNVLQGQNHFFRKYDSRQGLPSSEVYHSVQDDDGYMWFSTDHGLVRYDGYQFRTFDVDDGLPENPVFTLYKDSKNRVWFVTLSGKLGYHDKGKIYHYRYNDRLVDYLRLNTKNKYTIYNDIVVDSLENIWLSLRSEGLFRIDSLGNIVQLNHRQNNHSVVLVYVPVSDGKLLIDFAKVYPTRKIILQSAEGRSDTIDVSRKLEPRGSGHFFNATIALGEDVYFSEDNVVFRFRSGKLIDRKKLSHPITRMNSDRQGRIWMSTNGGGGRLFDKDLNEIDVFLDGEPISSFFEDHEGGLWFTSMNSGLFYIPEKRNRVIVPPSMFRQEKITDLKIDKQNRLWFSSFNVFGYSSGSYNQTFKASRLGDTIISRILPDPEGKYLWIGTNRGLMKFDVGKGNMLPFSSLSEAYYTKWGVKSLFYDTINNILWVGSYAGFYGVKPTSGLTQVIGLNELNRVEAITSAGDGTIFLGDQNGLYSWDGHSLRPVRSFGLGQWRVTALKWRNDSLWIGTRERGLLLLTNDTLISFGRREGLLSSSVNFVELKGEMVIAGTNKGISVLGRASDGGGFLIVQNITSGYGLLANEVSAMTLLGDKIVASSAGFISFLQVNPTLLMRISMPCHITSVSTENKIIDNYLTEPVVLRHNENNISFSYFAISFFIQGRHTYRHRLAGLENEWVVNQQTTASYPYLPPGNYTFEVQVQNPDGSWSATAEPIEVTVLRPLWMKWWVISIMVVVAIVLLLALFYVVSRYFTRQRNIVNDMWRYQQEALALQMNPHFLFNALNTVQRYILENDKMASSRYLTRFAGLMRAMLENAQKPDTSLSEEIHLLRQYIELESARMPQKFTYEIQCDELIDQENTLIPVFLIQPLVENAIQHGLKAFSGEGNIQLRFSQENQTLVVVVEDNGIGREAASKQRTNKKNSLGLSIIQKRILLINKSRQTNISLEITDLYTTSGEAAGTKAILRFPGQAKLKYHE
ncbi:MAG: histidine kinase [Bacteroidia bacterium]|nr:histidine kinase [Bacteroidia bacterium]